MIVDSYDRLADYLIKNKGDDIRDKEELGVVYEDITGIPLEGRKLNAVWASYIHRARGGKSLKLDRQRKAKDTVSRASRYKDARRQDLKGVDTPKVHAKRKHVFRYKGRQRTKSGRARVVEVRRIYITWYGKRVPRYIGRNGKYAKRYD